MAMERRYRLVIVSNIDDDLFAHTARQLQVTFAKVITAQQVRSYKPGLRHFEVMLQALRVPADRVLHVAGSLFHDIAPARLLGLANVWVRRRHTQGAHGATRSIDVTPNLTVPDLQTLVEHMRLT
jgi:2-haloacid dehalogenase